MKVHSDTYDVIVDEPFICFDVEIIFSEIDWHRFESEHSLLTASPEDHLFLRIERAVKPGVSLSRVAEKNRHRMFDGYEDHWIPYIQYLMYAHVFVFLVGAGVELLIDSGRSYIFFYWVYLFSLCLAILAWLGMRLKYQVSRYNSNYETGFTLSFESLIAKFANSMMIASGMVFSSPFY